MYFLDTHSWDYLESSLSKDNLTSAELLVQSCFYDQTNRSEEAYACSRKALALEESDPAVEKNDQAILWLAHGLHAAKCGHYEQAAIAFRMSYTENQQMDSLYYWVDELLQQGLPAEEAIQPIERWLHNDPAQEEKLILLKHRSGLDTQVLKDFEPMIALSDQLIHIRFESLLRVGRIAEAALLLLEQSDEYRHKYPTDVLLHQVLIADDKLPAFISQLSPYELQALQERAVALRLFSLAETLQSSMEEPLSIAFILYRNGYVMRSAAFFLQALKDKTLSREGYRCLGEILYYRGAYEQASGMFEYLLEQQPENTSLRTALALACLRQSEVLLNESMYIFPSSVFLREEAEKVARGVQHMESSGAITRWKWAERANFHA
jgi:tetratricopeptide (TPR) repeat protein